MFFVLMDHSGAARPHFGYLIAKNPASPPFDRSLSGSSDAIGRRVVGRYEGEEMNPNTYVVTVENDELAWMEMLRDANRPHYVSASPYAVTPLNLKGVGVALRTAIDGKDASKGALPEGEVSAPRPWTAMLGPFALPDDFVLDVYAGLGLSPLISREAAPSDLRRQLFHLSSETAVTVALTATLPLAEFLQKVLVGAYALTLKQHNEKYLDDGLVESLMRMSLGWVNAVPNKDKIMARLTQGSTDLLRTWAEAIRGDAEEAAPAETPEVQERRASLHARRHEVILRHIPETQSGQAARSLRVVDLGCGDGKLTVKILKERPGSKVLAIDADAMNLERLFRNVRRAFKRPRVAVDTETTKTVAPGDLVAESADGESPVLSVELGRGVTAFVAGATREELTEPSIKSRYKDRQDNIVLPEVEDHDRDPDVLVLSEVIEHLLPEDRHVLIENVATLWRAKRVILTTPNRGYNPVWGIPDGTLRHKDHKVEYDYTDLLREVLSPLRREGYDVRVVPLLTREDANGPYTLISSTEGKVVADGMGEFAKDGIWSCLIQPSWVVVADLRADAPPERTYKPVYEAREAHAAIHLHESGYTVRHGEMTVGLCHPIYLGHRTGIAWLAPTVPPVEHLEEEPDYLEHPMAAFHYYDARGVRELVAEVKYMGSRMTVTAFVDHEAASKSGHDFDATDVPLFAWSRQGYPFFDDRAMKLRLHESLHRGGFFIERDVVVLDGEFMPWSFKAGQGDRNLITQAFQTPGEVARIDARFKGDAARVARADAFLKALRGHAAEVSPAFVPFDVKLTGRIKAGQRWLDNPRLGMRTRAHTLAWLSDRVRQSHQGGYESLLQACDWHPVYMDQSSDVKHSIDLWKAYCAAGGEGFVYKPMRPETLPDGAPVQAALKVRGRDYLRLIYGINYLEPEFFARVKRRNGAAKRRLALQENLLAERILRAFMRGERRERDRYIAAFLGCDGVEGKSIDATL